MNTRLVTRIRVEAPIASFRYPFFLIGRQVSYDMPPPSTIYGHIATVLGELPEPASVQFGYHFTYAAKGQDLEHQQIIYAGGAKFEQDGVNYPTSVQGTVQPHLRDFLFQPRLTLYLDGEQWAEIFQNPVFCVALGRSQDLASITKVEKVKLEPANDAYFEQTLLPFSWRGRVGRGTTVQMPRYIEPPPERFPHFDRYVALRERVFDSEDPTISVGLRILRGFGRQTDANPHWVDPESPAIHGMRRGVVFHSFQ